MLRFNCLIFSCAALFVVAFLEVRAFIDAPPECTVLRLNRCFVRSFRLPINYLDFEGSNFFYGNFSTTTPYSSGKSRRFPGSGREHFPIPDLTQIQTRSYDAFLQLEVPVEKRKDQGLEAVLARYSRSKATTKRLSWTTSSTNWGSPAIHRKNAGNCGSPTASHFVFGCV